MAARAVTGNRNNAVSFGKRQHHTARTRTGKPEARAHAMDYSILFLTLFLVGFGLVVLYSTSSYRGSMDYGDPAYWLKRQGIFAAAGIVAMLIIARANYHICRIKLFQIICYGLIAAALIITLGFSVASNGARRWISIAGIQVQPSEFAKIVLILCLASYIDAYSNELQNWKNLWKPLMLAIPLFALVGVENLSTALILLAITFCMLFVANPKYLPFLGVAAIGICGGMILLFTRSYRMTRVTTWLHPESSENGEQTMKGLYAIGSGGLFGKGLGQSMQKMILPEASNDMIFSIITEELGIFGAICVLALFLVLLWRLLIIAINAQELLGSMIVVGIIVHIGVQVIINVAVATNSIPNTGIPLPFISYGGSSMVSLLMEMGVALSVSRYIRIPKRTKRRSGGNEG